MADLSFCIVCFVGHTIGNNTTSQERKYTIYYLGRFSFSSLFIMSRFFLGLTFSFISCALAAQTFDETIAVKIGDKIVELEVARTSVEHRTGLMNRSYLPADHGMLFVFAAPRPTAMWMKNTLIDLDAAFIDACGRITQIVSMQKAPFPCCRLPRHRNERRLVCPQQRQGRHPDPGTCGQSLLQTHKRRYRRPISTLTGALIVRFDNKRSRTN